MQGIYKLQFNNCDLVYIGKSGSISERYKNHCRFLKAGTHTNYKLLNMYNKFKEFPKIDILEEVTSIYNLNSREIFWIEKLDSFNNGFNLTKGGDIEFGEGSPASKYANEQYYAVLFKLAYSDDIYDKISKDTGVHKNTIKNLVSQKSQLHLKELYPEIYKAMLLKKGTRKYNLEADIYISVLQDLLNLDYSIPDIEKKHFLTSSTVHGILNGKYSFLDKILVNTARNLRPINKQTNFKDILLKAPNNSIHKITNTQKDFAIKHTLDKGALSALLKGKSKSHRGWTLV